MYSTKERVGTFADSEGDGFHLVIPLGFAQDEYGLNRGVGQRHQGGRQDCDLELEWREHHETGTELTVGLSDNY